MNKLSQVETDLATTKLMANRVALVTGASRGIGAEIAKLFGRHGAAVGANYYSNEAAAQSVVDAIVAEGGKAVAVKADVKDPRQVEVMVQQVVEALGPIDTLVLNAAGSFKVAPFTEYSWEDFEAKLLGEVKSTFHPVKAVVPAMIEQNKGCIIVMSSEYSRFAGQGFSAHSTAKSALDALVKSLAFELGPHGIRVNAVSPGLTITDASAFVPQERRDAIAQMTPLRRIGVPEDIASAVLLLASEHSRFITGAYLPVNGGIFMP
ncbi:Short-chain dehydrogenase [Nostoc sp. DSM 114161]|jgi:3-oxoacyl-[acyl-carrier protein] reductase|uniref:SDR family NAD(P)-dependent oxidoreductase n=1 Tax=Nostoc sp. DSM 114161 TaxID=3440143 RepID=UPI004046716E